MTHDNATAPKGHSRRRGWRAAGAARFGAWLALALAVPMVAAGPPLAPSSAAAAPVTPAAAAAVRVSLAPGVAGASDARVLVNGKVLGSPPLELALHQGRYLIEITAAGYQTWRHWIDAVAGQSLNLVAPLEPIAAPASQPAVPPPPRGTLTAPRGTLTVTSTVAGAEVSVDGEAIGTAPVEGAELLAGPHVVAVRAPRHEELLTTVEVVPGAAVRIDARLQRTGAASPRRRRPSAAPGQDTTPEAGPQSVGTSLSPRRRTARTMASHAATLVDAGWVAGDVSLGFPYLIAARLTVGLLDKGPLGVDGAVELRSFGAMTEVGARARVRLIDQQPWSLATSVALGGGGGPKSRNSFFVDLAAIGSVWLAERVALTARATLGVYTDRLCPASASRNEVGACGLPPAGLSPTAVRERFTGLRFLLAGVVEVPINAWLNVFGLFEFAPWQGNRRSFSDPFVSLMPSSDPGAYGCLGVTFKR